MTKRIAIFASGGGSNAQKIIEHFKHHQAIQVDLVISNKAQAGVLSMAQAYNIATLVIDRAAFYETDEVVKKLHTAQIDLIVLAGFLWKVPDALIAAFPGAIVNIHPSLLPKFGGKGMYGMHVHKAVVAAGETESGPTIHYVNEHYDEGQIIFQATCEVLANDTPEALQQRVLALEHKHYPTVIEQLLTHG